MKNLRQLIVTAVKKSILWIVLLSFMIPYVLAQWIYQHPEHFSTTLNRKNNHGRLLTPALSLNDFRIQSLLPVSEKINGRGHWQLIYLSSTACDAECLKKVYNIRQIRTLLNQNKNRVDRVLWVTKPLPPEITAQIKEHFEGTQIWQSNAVALQTGYLIADPHGNVILQFDPNTNLNDIFLDLKKLLTWSQIG